MSVGIQLSQLSSEQLTRFAELIYTVAGIKISPQKKTMLSNRLRRRLKANDMHDFDVYFNHLKGLSVDDPEWDAFLQEVSTHETFLFRDANHWTWFQTEFLPEIVVPGAQRRTAEEFANLVCGLQHGRRSIHDGQLHCGRHQRLRPMEN